MDRIKKTKKQCQNNPTPHDDNPLAQTILDSLTAHVAILDDNGFILATNRAWKRFARENNLQIRPQSSKVNYLEICESTGAIEGDDEGSYVAGKIRDVIAGRLKEFVLDYPCHSPEKNRWFYMRVTRATGSGPIRIVVSHENITALRETENHLLKSKEELLEEKRKLEEANMALKVLLKQNEANQRDLEADVIDNVHRFIRPVLNRLTGMNLPKQANALIASLDHRILGLTAPFFRRLSNMKTILTPQEIEVAALIREGRSTKEIAAHLNLSVTTVNFHRRNLRQKFKLNNTVTNLRTFLMGADGMTVFARQ